jgi:membrane-associated phospholipid phosphatase
MDFLNDVPTDFINNVTPIWADTIIFCATTLGVVMVLCAYIFIIFRKFPHENAFSSIEHLVKKAGDVFLLFISSSTAYIFSVFLKNTFKIGRPEVFDLTLHPLLNPQGYGFPSSHAAFYGAIAITIFFMDRTAGYIAMVIALIIGAARVFTGVHSPLDVLGGFLLALLVSSFVDFIVEKLSDWRTR